MIASNIQQPNCGLFTRLFGVFTPQPSPPPALPLLPPRAPGRAPLWAAGGPGAEVLWQLGLSRPRLLICPIWSRYEVLELKAVPLFLHLFPLKYLSPLSRSSFGRRLRRKPLGCRTALIGCSGEKAGAAGALVEIISEAGAFLMHPTFSLDPILFQLQKKTTIYIVCQKILITVFWRVFIVVNKKLLANNLQNPFSVAFNGTKILQGPYRQTSHMLR